MNNKKILIKIIMYILTISYMILFVYQYLKNGFNLDENNNIVKIILIFISFISCSIASITNSKTTYFFAFTNYIIITILFILSIIPYIPKNNTAKTDKKIETKEIICNGKSDISDNTIIEVVYQGDKINKLIYTYKFDKDSEDGAKNLINKFDIQYNEFDTIYSEITISDDVIVKFTYNIEHINLDKLDSNITSFKKLKANELNNMTCKNRDF